MKKSIIYWALTCFSLLIMGSCEKEGDKLILSGLDSSELNGSESDIILTQDNNEATMLSLAWSESELTISDESVSIPNSVPRMLVEVSGTVDFALTETFSPDGNLFSFTGSQLNTLAKNFGFEPAKATPMYFRVRSAYGTNTDAYYSNVITVNVTSYAIDMSKGFILDSDQEETGFYLYSPESDGVYSGFAGATAWFNWYLKEGDRTIWGNDGVAGTEFLLSSDAATMWNMWYPGQGGCYYTSVNTNTSQWSAMLIPSLQVSGDVSGEMVFDRGAVKWFISVTTTTDNATVRVSTTEAKQYNISTGTSDDDAMAREMGFVTEGADGLSFEMTASAASAITFGAAGEYTLTFYLSDATNWFYEITEGTTVIEEPISEFLYLPGIDDGISGNWTFDNYLKLVSEDDSTFAGVVTVNSLWGYNMALEKDNWEDVYKMGDTEGTLVFQGPNNITAPSPGLYLIQADLKNLTYSHTEVASVSYAGFNDDWNMVGMTASDVEGVYTSSIDISGASEWGAKLYLNGSWDHFFGGSEGTLYYGSEGITDDALVDPGTYDLVANLKAGSYVLLGDEIYVAGLNDVWDFTSVVLSKQSTGVYEGSATLSADTPWGMAIHLDQSWNRYFGGSLDGLSYLGGNITDIPTTLGTYTIRVDFINNTCTFEMQ